MLILISVIENDIGDKNSDKNPHKYHTVFDPLTPSFPPVSSNAAMLLMLQNSRKF